MAPVLNTKELAEYLNVSERTLEKYRMEGDGPRFVKLSARAVRYRVEDVEAWLNNNLRSNTYEETNDEGD